MTTSPHARSSAKKELGSEFRTHVCLNFSLVKKTDHMVTSIDVIKRHSEGVRCCRRGQCEYCLVKRPVRVLAGI